MDTEATHTLFHVHDPMCSWCWGFKPVWSEVRAGLNASVNVQYLLGGLAPDSDEPMPIEMQTMLQGTWHRIQQTIPGTQFNFDFWTNNTPRRSTWPSCRAVIAVRHQNQDLETSMIEAIQTAYYLQARNPSDHDVLADIAAELGCDRATFLTDLNSEAVQQEFVNERAFAARIGAQGFPSLFLATPENLVHPIAINYSQSQAILDQVGALTSR
jgi:putative protein-disulfide isomerase